MENYSVSISKYQPESPDRAYSDDSPVRHEYPTYADDAQFFDIDISLPLSPTDITPVASSDDDDTEDEFDLDSFFCKPKPPNPNQCISPPAENLFHQGQQPPLDDTDKDIPFPQSCNVPGVKIQFPKLLKTATKLNISLLGFKKYSKPATDLQSPSAEQGVAMDSPVPKQNRFVTLKLKLKRIEESINFINSRPKPLCIYLFSNNKDLKERVVSETSSGSVAVNDTIVQFAIDTMPFGGVGESGFGKCHGKFSFDTFSHPKAILYRGLFPDFAPRYPPWNDFKLSFMKEIL